MRETIRAIVTGADDVTRRETPAEVIAAYNRAGQSLKSSGGVKNSLRWLLLERKRILSCFRNCENMRIVIKARLIRSWGKKTFRKIQYAPRRSNRISAGAHQAEWLVPRSWSVADGTEDWVGCAGGFRAEQRHRLVRKRILLTAGRKAKRKDNVPEVARGF